MVEEFLAARGTIVISAPSNATAELECGRSIVFRWSGFDD